MVQRQAMNLVDERLRRSPAVGLIGPRHCGKTTLARSLTGAYFDLEVEAEPLRLDLQWKSLWLFGKSLKVYWRDTGLLHALLQTRTHDDLLVQPWVGASWEGFVIEQVLDHLAARGRAVQPYFVRTSDQYEIDLVLDFGRSLWAVETKLTASPSVGDAQRLNKAADIIGADQRVLVARVPENLESERLVVTDLPGLLNRLDDLG
jgi:predicted AAA+ superfamily ATPase